MWSQLQCAMDAGSHASISNGSNGSNGAAVLPPLSIPRPVETAKWALAEADFRPGLVGGKSANLATLRSKVGKSLSIPCCQ